MNRNRQCKDERREKARRNGKYKLWEARFRVLGERRISEGGVSPRVSSFLLSIVH